MDVIIEPQEDNIMSGEKRCKNKSCNAPLLPGFETEHGLCTRCMNAADKKERMKKAANIISNIETAKIKTPSRSTSTPLDVITQPVSVVEDEKPTVKTPSTITSKQDDVIIQGIGDLANNNFIGVRISTVLLNKLKQRLMTTNITQSQFLRSLIEDSLAKDK